MTLAKAIEIVSLAAHGKAFTTGPDWTDALKLLIEAGKQVLQMRAYAKDLFLPKLPGEEVEK